MHVWVLVVGSTKQGCPDEALEMQSFLCHWFCPPKCPKKCLFLSAHPGPLERLSRTMPELEVYNHVHIYMHRIVLAALLGQLYSTQARMSRMVYAEYTRRLQTGVPGKDAHPDTNHSIAHKPKHFWPTFAQPINLKLFTPLHQV